MRWVVRSQDAAREVVVERTAAGFEVLLDGRRLAAELLGVDASAASLRFVEDGRSFWVGFQRSGRRWRLTVCEREFDLEVLTPLEASVAVSDTQRHGASVVEAPIPGKVVAVKVAVGDTVESGQPLVVLEAMKMENELAAERSGRVAAIHVAPGATVESGTLLVELE